MWHLEDNKSCFPAGRPDLVVRKNLNSQSADNQPLVRTCYVLSGLEAEAEYYAEVRALDGGTGVPSRTFFRTTLDGQFMKYRNEISELQFNE